MHQPNRWGRVPSVSPSGWSVVLRFYLQSIIRKWWTGYCFPISISLNHHKANCARGAVKLCCGLLILRLHHCEPNELLWLPLNLIWYLVSWQWPGEIIREERTEKNTHNKHLQWVIHEVFWTFMYHLKITFSTQLKTKSLLFSLLLSLQVSLSLRHTAYLIGKSLRVKINLPFPEAEGTKAYLNVHTPPTYEFTHRC